MKTFRIMFPFSTEGREGGMDGNRWMDGRVVSKYKEGGCWKHCISALLDSTQGNPTEL